MKKILKITLLVLMVTVMGISAQAQVNPLPDNGGPGAGGSGTPNVNPPGTNGDGAVPFDGGLSLILLAAGAGVGAKKRTASAK